MTNPNLSAAVQRVIDCARFVVTCHADAVPSPAMLHDRRYSLTYLHGALMNLDAAERGWDAKEEKPIEISDAAVKAAMDVLCSHTLYPPSPERLRAALAAGLAEMRK